MVQATIDIERYVKIALNVNDLPKWDFYLSYALLLLLWGNALRRNEVSTLDVRHFDIFSLSLRTDTNNN